MNDGGVAIGIDLGTSAVKVLAVTLDGRQVALASEFYGLITPQPDEVEQDPEVVYRASMRVLKRVVADVQLRGLEVAAIGFSCAMHGVLCVDAGGEPISNALTWMDRRAGAIADAWRADGTGLALYRETGAPMHAMLPVAKLRWLAENDRERFARSARFVGLKALFVFRWTGEWLVDWGIAGASGLFAFASRAWSAAALALARVEPERLAAPMAPSTRTSAIRPAIVRELGLTGRAELVLGSSDGALANIGIGAASGTYALTLGTSGALRTLAPHGQLDETGRTFCYPADDRSFLIGGPTSGAGAALDWILTLLYRELPKEQRFPAAVAEAEAIPPGAEGCVVLPFFGGERAPYWRSSLHGTLTGLDLAHDRRTLVRATIEGIVFGLRAVYDAMREGLPPAEALLLSGGLNKAPLVRSIVADTFGVPAIEPHQQEASALGAALFAAQSCGAIDDALAVAQRSGYDAPAQPVRERVDAYREAYLRYRKTVEYLIDA